MQYLSDIQDQIYEVLSDKIGADVRIERFYSDDVREVAFAMQDQYNVSSFPHVLVAVTRAESTANRGTGTEYLDDILVTCWILSETARTQQRAYSEAEKYALLTRAYLSGRQFQASEWTNRNDIDEWSVDLEFEDDEESIYSVRGTLSLEIDLNKLIEEYESA